MELPDDLPDELMFFMAASPDDLLLEMAITSLRRYKDRLKHYEAHTEDLAGLDFPTAKQDAGTLFWLTDWEVRQLFEFVQANMEGDKLPPHLCPLLTELGEMVTGERVTLRSQPSGDPRLN